MPKQFAGDNLETREACLVKRRSFPNSFGYFTFHLSRTTYEEDGIGASSYRSHEIGMERKKSDPWNVSIKTSILTR